MAPRPAVTAAHALLVLARVAGRAHHRLIDRYSARLRAVFPALSPAAARAAGARLEANRFTREASRRLARVLGWAPLASLTDLTGAGADALATRGPRGALVVVWHAGLGAAVLGALARAGHAGLVLHDRAAGPLAGFTAVATGRSVAARALAFEAALRHLRGGGVVALFIDVHPPWASPPPRPLSLWSRVVGLPRGPAALARLARADVYSARATWRGGTPPIAVTLDAPLPPPARADDEAAWTLALGRRFEQAMTDDPGELWPLSLAFIAGAARQTAPPQR